MHFLILNIKNYCTQLKWPHPRSCYKDGNHRLKTITLVFSDEFELNYRRILYAETVKRENRCIANHRIK
jgi:hypothetical protein